MVGVRSLSQFALLAAAASGAENATREEACMHIKNDNWDPVNCKAAFGNIDEVVDEADIDENYFFHRVPLGSQDIARQCIGVLNSYRECLDMKGNATDNDGDKAYYRGRVEATNAAMKKLQYAIEHMNSTWCPEELLKIKHEEKCFIQGQVAGWHFTIRGDPDTDCDSNSGSVLSLGYGISGSGSWCETDADCGDIMCPMKCVDCPDNYGNCFDDVLHVPNPKICLPNPDFPGACSPPGLKRHGRAWFPDPAAPLSKCPVQLSGEDCEAKYGTWGLWDHKCWVFSRVMLNDPQPESELKRAAKECYEVLVATDECINETFAPHDKAYARTRLTRASTYALVSHWVNLAELEATSGTTTSARTTTASTARTTTAATARTTTAAPEAAYEDIVCMDIKHTTWDPTGCQAAFEENMQVPLGSKHLALKCSGFLASYHDCLYKEGNATDDEQLKLHYRHRVEETDWLVQKLQTAIEHMDSRWCPDELWEWNMETWEEGCGHHFEGYIPGWFVDGSVHGFCDSSSNSSGGVVNMAFRRSGLYRGCETDADCGDIMCPTKCMSHCTDCEHPVACVPMDHSACHKDVAVWAPDPSNFLSQCPVQLPGEDCGAKYGGMWETNGCFDLLSEDPPPAGDVEKRARACYDIVSGYNACMVDTFGPHDMAYARMRQAPKAYFDTFSRLMGQGPRKCINVPAFQAEKMKMLPCGA